MTDPAPQIWLQSASGAVIDLMAPSLAGLLIMRDLIEPISRICRFTGHVPDRHYSVAQHCVIGADAAFAETGELALAAAVLLHDLHEALIGDIATPIQVAMRRASVLRHGPGADEVTRSALDHIKGLADRAIYEAAGLGWPLDGSIREYVATMDLRLLATERKHLLRRAPQPWAAAVEAAAPLNRVRSIPAWTWKRAAAEYRIRAERLCPDLLAI